MKDPAPQLLADGFVFPEGPRWHAGSLWFSDMHGGTVHRVSLQGDVTQVLELAEDKPSGLGFLPSGDLLVVAMRRRRILRHDGASMTVHAELAHLTGDELNDMLVDREGRAYVGSYPHERNAGVLLRVEPDGSAQVEVTGLDFPNGTVLTEDGHTLIVTESRGRRHTAFDVAADGSLTGRREYVAHAEAAGDGLALDAEGGLWVALPLAHAWVRLVPGAGVTHRIEAGEQMAVACALGGPDRRSLFLLSAPAFEAAELAGRREGRIQVLTVDVPGAGLP